MDGVLVEAVQAQPAGANTETELLEAPATTAALDGTSV
jgi:hypothetical protein